MKKLMVLMLAAFMLVACSCGRRSEGPGGESLRSQASVRLGGVVTENGVYYFGKAAGMGSIIYYCDKEGGEPYVLCGKPNCRHCDESCNAYGGFALGFTGGRLYTVRDGLELVSMEPDGTGHKKVADMPKVRYSDGSAGGGGYFFDLGDSLLYIIAANLTRPYEEQLCHFWLIDYQTGKSRELFTSLTSVNHLNPGVVDRVGDLIYTQIELQPEDGASEVWMMELDLANDAWRKLFPSQPIAAWAVYEGTLYYYVPDEGFMEYDLESGETVNRGDPVPDGQWACFDEDCVYLMGSEREDGGRTLYFLTREYGLIDELELPNGESPNFVTEDRIYFSADWTSLDAYLEKALIGGGALALRRLGE